MLPLIIVLHVTYFLNVTSIIDSSFNNNLPIYNNFRDHYMIAVILHVRWSTTGWYYFLSFKSTNNKIFMIIHASNI